MSTIVYNAIKTPDGTLLESKFTHEFVEHLDSNGKIYMIDGGLDYIRRSVNGDEEILTVTLDDPHKKVREFLIWGTHGKNGDQPLSYIKLKDMSIDHIKNCLKLSGIYPQIIEAFKNELDYRKNISTPFY